MLNLPWRTYLSHACVKNTDSQNEHRRDRDRGTEKIEVQMRRTTVITLLIILIILIIVGFFITDPELGEQILVDLGLSEPVQGGYVLSGLIEAQVTYLSSENGGRLEQILAAEGEAVEGGEDLIVLDQSLLEPEYDAAVARLDFAQAQLEMIESGPRDVDFDVAEAAVNQAEAVKQSAIIALEDARDYEPFRLRDEQISIAKAVLDQANANLLIVESTLARLRAGATEAEIDSVEALVMASEAEVARFEAMIDKQTIVAPLDAFVLELFLSPGEVVIPGQPLLSLTNLNELQVTVYIPEFDLNWASIGDLVEVRFSAYPDKQYAGVVVHISDHAEFTPRNVQTPDERVILVFALKIRIANPGGDLKPGLTVDVIFGGES